MEKIANNDLARHQSDQKIKFFNSVSFNVQDSFHNMISFINFIFAFFFKLYVIFKERRYSEIQIQGN